MGCLTDWREQPSREKGAANNSSVSFLGRDARPISVPAAGGADCALCSEIAGGGASQLLPLHEYQIESYLGLIG